MWENTPGCAEKSFLDTVWEAVDKVCPGGSISAAGCMLARVPSRLENPEKACCLQAITMQECDVYSYKSDGEMDPLSAHQRVG